jgi:hypothetical protein
MKPALSLPPIGQGKRTLHLPTLDQQHRMANGSPTFGITATFILKGVQGVLEYSVDGGFRHGRRIAVFNPWKKGG